VRPFHHLGYVVDDLERAAERLARDTGAGPFLMIEHVPLERVTYDDAPARYDHSTAFGQWGPVIIEISRIHDAEPAGLRDFFSASPPPAIGHVAWLVDDLKAESDRLQAAGLPLRHTGHSGPVSAHWHDGASVLGHPVEVLRRCPEILGFYTAIGDAARNWDGSRPLRPAPSPPDHQGETG
jgi:catechol 2,3-dioxygenase-like lactoylglutathione lyase family enzyme